MSHHVEPGSILKRIGGTKMAEQNIEDLRLEYIEVYTKDKEGNTVKVKLY
jgi:hypothetical protein